MNKDCIIVFARNPVLGGVKTRIARETDNETALRIYQVLLQKTLITVSTMPQHSLVAFADSIPKDSIDFPIENFELQLGYDLGIRMQQAFRWNFNKGFDKIVLIGSDCYDLSNDVIQKAFDELDNHTCVIGPAEDGGYYLIGLNKKINEIFVDIEWGTKRVYQQTTSILDSLNISYTNIDTLTDIDTLSDVLKIPELQDIVEELSIENSKNSRNT